MNFVQRLGYFGFGVGLGCLIVYALLIRDRDFPAWLPEDRVLEALAVDSIIVSPDLNLNFPDSILIEKILGSDVLFRESIVRDAECREYQLESEVERMRFRICKDSIELYEYEPNS